MQGLNAGGAEDGHHGRKLPPRLLALLPVVLDPCRGLIDLAQHVARVAGWSRAGIERVLQLRPFGKIVTKKRLGSLAMMPLGHPRAMARQQAINRRLFFRGYDERDEQMGLSFVRHGSLRVSILTSGLGIKSGDDLG